MPREVITQPTVLMRVGASMFMPAVVFLSAANSVILRNLKDLPYPSLVVLVFGALFGGSTLAILPVFLRAARSMWYRQCAKGILVLAVCILLWDTVAHFRQKSPGSDVVLLCAVFSLATLLLCVRFRLTIRDAGRQIVDGHLGKPFSAWSGSLRTAVAAITACIVGSVLAVDLWALADYMVTVAQQDAISAVLLRGSIDGSLALLATAAIFRVPFHVSATIFGSIAPLLVAFELGTHTLTFLRFNQPAAPSPGDAAALEVMPAGPREFGNIYHILLDAFPHDAFEILAEETPALRFSGFTSFTNAHSNYSRTTWSLPSLLHGRFYQHGESLNAFRFDALRGGAWATLALADVNVTMYPLYPLHCSPHADSCHAMTTLVRDQAGNLTERLLFDLWFEGLLPSSLREWLAQRGQHFDPPAFGQDATPVFSLTRYVWAERAEGSGAWPVRHLPPYSVLNYDRMLEAERKRPPRNQYVFVHVLAPHEPYVLDCTCRYVGTDDAGCRSGRLTDSSEALLEQAACALGLVERLVHVLKTLDRYDDALILVHADHASIHGLPKWADIQHPGLLPVQSRLQSLRSLNVNEDDSATWPSQAIDMMSHILLLAKFPHAQEFSVSSAPAELIDIVPTLATHIGVNADGMPGVPLQTSHDSIERERVFFATSMQPTLQEPRVFSKYVWEGGGWRYQEDLFTRK